VSPYDRDGRPVDDAGRQIPHQLGVVAFMRAIPGFADQFRPVPAGFSSRMGENVRCPCGAKPRLEPLALTRCVGGCGRIYVRSRTTVYVGYGTPDAEESGS
jgi:hypothetical protein